MVSGVNGPKIAGDSLDLRDDMLLTGANRGVDQLQLWDWRTKKLISTFKWDEEKNVKSSPYVGNQCPHFQLPVLQKFQEQRRGSRRKSDENVRFGRLQ